MRIWRDDWRRLYSYGRAIADAGPLNGFMVLCDVRDAANIHIRLPVCGRTCSVYRSLLRRRRENATAYGDINDRLVRRATGRRTYIDRGRGRLGTGATTSLDPTSPARQEFYRRYSSLGVWRAKRCVHGQVGTGHVVDDSFQSVPAPTYTELWAYEK